MLQLMALAFAVLAGAAAAYWDIPACPKNATSRVVGRGLALPLPPKAKVRRYGDVDFVCTSISLPRAAARIQACSGPHYTYGRPSLVGRAADHLEERLIRWPSMPTDWPSEYGPREVRGIAQGGKRWRYIGMIGASLEYDGADAQSARTLDQVMDSVCYATFAASAAP